MAIVKDISDPGAGKIQTEHVLAETGPGSRQEVLDQ
jgi:hypothetical protein